MEVIKNQNFAASNVKNKKLTPLQEEYAEKLEAFQNSKNEKKTPVKLSFWQRVLKAYRISLMKNEVFIGDYHTNRLAVMKFITKGNFLLVHVDPGQDKIHKFDYRLNGTQAKKERKVVVWYVKDHWLYNNFMTRAMGWKNHWLKVMIGFNDNVIQRKMYGGF